MLNIYIILSKAKSEEWRRKEGLGCSYDLAAYQGTIWVGVKEERVLTHSQGKEIEYSLGMWSGNIMYIMYNLYYLTGGLRIKELVSEEKVKNGVLA